MRADQQLDAITRQMQSDMQIFIAINLIAALAVLALAAWGIIWSINIIRRWEQRDEAKLRAFQRFVANMDRSNNQPSSNQDHMRAD